MWKKIAVIGAGNMGSAIAASVVGDGCQVVCTAATEKTLRVIKETIPGVGVSLSNAEAVKDADMIVLAVKPYVAPDVYPEILPNIKKGSVIVSVIASLPICELENIFDSRANGLSVARVVPNTAIRYGKSVTFISFADNVSAGVMTEITDIFNRSGKAFVINERYMPVCTALASCGIAFFLRFIRAAAEGSVELGLKADFATEIAALTAAGAAELLKNGSHPEVEIDKVATPGGITIRGLNALEEHGFTTAVVSALRASTAKG